MELSGSTFVKQPIDLVWAALNDEAVLQRCITGCETMERIDANEIAARLAMKMGPVRARFNGKVVMSNVLPLEGYKLTFEGSGGAAGFAKGSSVVGLKTVEGGTQVNYTAQASIGGKLGQIGGRMIDAAARSMADDFFTAFAASFKTPDLVESTEKAQAPVAMSSSSVAATKQSNDSSQAQAFIWFAAGAITATVLLLIGKNFL